MLLGLEGFSYKMGLDRLGLLLSAEYDVNA